MYSKISTLPKGLWPVMLTPFDEDGSIDYEGLKKLTEFYLQSGAKGLFVNCLSSEMYHLSPKERLKITESVVKFVDDRIPVVSTGTFGGKIETQVDYIKDIWSTGVAAVIIVSSIIVKRTESSKTLLSRLQALTRQTEKIPLGIYECPKPYKRLINPKIIKWISKSRRFVYYKDTSCDLDNIRSKLDMIEDSSILRLYNANTTTALDSLKLGAHGLSPISANFYPELYKYLINNYQNPEKKNEIEYLQKMLTLMDAVTHNNSYPLAAKIFLNKRGLPLNTKVRVEPLRLNYEELTFLDNLYEVLHDVSRDLDIKLCLK